MCRRFGTPSSIFIGGVSRKINGDEIVGVLYGKSFGSKIACAIWKEGNGKGVCPSSEYRKDPKGRPVVRV
jgi:hypothetical protein